MEEAVDCNQVEEAVESLYRYNSDPEYIRKTQHHLQNLQRSSHGWILANRLLKSNSTNCQFFGALTYTVKLNGLGEGEILNPDDDEGLVDGVNPNELLSQLTNWLLIHRHSNKRMVMQKLLSTLALYFTKFPGNWPNCIPSLVSNFGSEPYNTTDLSLGLHFCKILVEDLETFSGSETQLSKINEVLVNEENMNCLVRLLVKSFDRNNHSNEEIVIEAMYTYGAWVSYLLNSKLNVEALIPFLECLLLYFNEPESDDVYEAVCDLINDLFILHPTFLSVDFKTHFGKILLAQARSILELRRGNDWKSVEERISAFTKVCVNYAQHSTMKYLADPESCPEFIQFLGILTELAVLPGIHIGDDPIAVDVLEFWTSYIENIPALETQQEKADQIPCIERAFNIYWDRMKFPSDDVLSDWYAQGNDKIDQFNSLRRDFLDFLEIAYEIIGTPLFKFLIDAVKNSMNHTRSSDSVNNYSSIPWDVIECSLYCLNGLAELIKEEEYQYLHELLNIHDLFVALSLNGNERVRKTSVHFLGSYEAFFEQSSSQPYLAPVLDYLFKTLKIQSLSLPASQSIQKLCSSSRHLLTPMLANFFETYKTNNLDVVLNSIAHERTVGAIACVIQAFDRDLDQQAEYLKYLVEMIVQQIEQVFQENSAEANAEPLDRVCSLLRCLINIAKGMQIPDHMAEEVIPANLQNMQEFWRNHDQGVRERALQVIRVLAIDQLPFNKQIEICEICCDLFKAGFSELVTGPFVFAPNAVLQFILSKYAVGPPSCLFPLSSLACCFITSQEFQHSSPADKLHMVNTLLDNFFNSSTTTYEPDIHTANLELLAQILETKQHEVFFSNPNIQSIIVFALQMMASKERFILRAASKFWTKFIVCTTQSEDKNQEFGLIFAQVGKDLCSILVRNVSGDSSRSELEYYTDVLRKILFHQSLISRPWFNELLIDQPNASALVRRRKDPGQLQRERQRTKQFVERLFLLKGSVETKKVVKEFWQTTAGMIDYMSK